MELKVSAIRRDNTHRLIPSNYGGKNPLQRLVERQREMDDLIELESVTNDRLLGEANLLPGISVHELLFGVSHAYIVNAAFTHAHPSGSRFNGPERGAWYAAFEKETARAEVEFHKLEELREIGWTEPETFTFDDYLADFRDEFHDLRKGKAYALYLAPDSYTESQALARTLLAEASAGIVYPSVRAKRGTCIVCFRPALVLNVRRTSSVTMTLKSSSGRDI